MASLWTFKIEFWNEVCYAIIFFLKKKIYIGVNVFGLHSTCMSKLLLRKVRYTAADGHYWVIQSN